ncbi:hypothetical protein AOQ84DRAFT_413909 [Glonium stellatum]|uniref:Uncharacterized protein n=1 Tax=Glonium stellatum TaxID=574774 RepID=A0A8E2EUQ5_9PEZI|nr:hypothetical protein AOQ84DRAFT_413909 [Glonium stellatum]
MGISLERTFFRLRLFNGLFTIFSSFDDPIIIISYSPSRGLSFLRHFSFWMLHIGNNNSSHQSIFCPTAEEIDLSSTTGMLLVAILYATPVSRNIIVEMINDYYQVSNVILFSTIGSTAAASLFWAFSSQMMLLTIFSTIYGFFGGGFSSR